MLVVSSKKVGERRYTITDSRQLEPNWHMYAQHDVENRFELVRFYTDKLETSGTHSSDTAVRTFKDRPFEGKKVQE